MSEDQGNGDGATGTDQTDGDTDAGQGGGDGGDQGAGKGGESKYTAPTESEWKASQEKLKKANAQAAAHRKEADELKRKGETDSEAAVRTAREESAAEAEKTWKPRLVKSAARAALAEAGLIGKPDRLLKLIDSAAVEFDDEGDVTGLDAQIRDLKKDYPEMFAKRGSGRIDGSDRGGNDGGDTKGGLSATSRRLLEQRAS
jgi:hypothetical protein